jgi:protein O-GlcNAc transferase
MNPQLQLMLQQAFQAFQSGNFDDADLILRDVLHKDIGAAGSIFQLGINLSDKNKLTEAEITFRCLQNFIKNDSRIPYNIGCLYVLRNDFDSAVKSFNEALQISPNDLDALLNSASALHEIGYYQEAINRYNKALSLKQDNFEAWSNKGNSLNKIKLYDEAISHHDMAISLNPNYHVAWMNKGLVLSELGCYEEAVACFDKALSLEPTYAEAALNKSHVLIKLKSYEEAALLAEKVSNNANFPEAWVNRGTALSELRHYDEAIYCYDKALNLNPNINFVYGDLVHLKLKICNWSDLVESLEDISKKVVANEKVINPFPLLALNDDVLLHKKSSEIYIQSRYSYNPSLGPILKRPQGQKIRVGYFSADFHNHATGHLMAELFELHDKSQFELLGFSFGPRKNDEMRQRLEKSFDQFIEVGNMSDIEIAKLSRNFNIDIAVDLKGFTQDARTGIFAYRAAPIQVNYLGYPGTMGADYMDYIIADKTLISPELQSCYSEKVIYLPNSYQTNDRKRLISERQFTRQELRLPEHGFVFCCFNNNYKILPATFERWMRILKAVDGSVLWLFQDNSSAKENLKKEAEKQGIASDRLVFAERLPLPEHLARHRQADLFLDTFPYNAHTTASDALWAGLPVLTLMGRSFASRVAASLLNAIGLPELITSSKKDYESLAIELALNSNKLADIKLRLANNRLNAPLFDTPLFTKNLEAAYTKIYGQYMKDLPPECIEFNKYLTNEYLPRVDKIP